MAWAIYEDLPITGDEIRLVNLLPSASDDDCLRCEFLVESLRKKPEYVCLSYTWGSQPLNSDIYFTGTRTPIPVTASCYHALRALRRANAKAVFVDQLSIDQTNIYERNSQIQLMDRIFGQAHRVYVWLDLPVLPELLRPIDNLQTLSSGSDDLVDQTKLASQITRPVPLPTVSPASASSLRMAPESSATPTSLEHNDLLSEAEELASCLVAVSQQPYAATVEQEWILLDKKAWAALESILFAPYFRRKWIIQEVCSNSDVEVLSRDSSCKLSCFTECYKVLGGRTLRYWFSRHDWATKFKTLSNCALMAIWHIKSARNASKPVSLLWLLQICRHTEALLPHDVLYAIRSMADSDISLPPPRYDMPVRQVLLEHAAEFIRKGYGLTLLEAGGACFSYNTTLPSWLPNWSKPVASSRYSPVGWNNERPAAPQKLNVEQTMALRLELSANLSTLNLSATVVDRIQSKLPLPKISRSKPWVYDDEWTSYVELFVGDYSRSKQAMLHTDATRWMAFRAQQLVGNHPQSAPISLDWKHQVTLLLAILYTWNCHADIKTNVDLRTRLKEATLVLLRDESQDETYRSQSLLEQLAGYEICTTERGNMGFIPSGSYTGDWIMSCHGVFDSMVIRPQWNAAEDTYVLMGDAFFLPFEHLFGSAFADPSPRRIHLI